jgi:hypothetical protein
MTVLLSLVLIWTRGILGEVMCTAIEVCWIMAMGSKVPFLSASQVWVISFIAKLGDFVICMLELSLLLHKLQFNYTRCCYIINLKVCQKRPFINKCCLSLYFHPQKAVLMITITVSSPKYRTGLN